MSRIGKSSSAFTPVNPMRHVRRLLLTLAVPVTKRVQPAKDGPVCFAASKRSSTTTIKLLSAGLFATVMLSAPAMACKNCLVKRHVARKANASVSPAARYIDGHARIPAPHVGPYAAPPDENNCDVGDNPFIC